MIYEHRTWLLFSAGESAEIEREVMIEYRYTRGYPATPPAYDHGGLPPEAPEVEVESIRVSVGGRDGAARWECLPDWMVNDLANDDELYAELTRAADDADASWRDYAAEARAERRGDLAAE